MHSLADFVQTIMGVLIAMVAGFAGMALFVIIFSADSAVVFFLGFFVGLCAYVSIWTYFRIKISEAIEKRKNK